MNNKLPEMCYGFLKSTKELIIIKRGESGYYRTDCFCNTKEEAQSLVDSRNELLGVTKQQAAAMNVGSMFGWNVPAANPECYDENGKIIGGK